MKTQEYTVSIGGKKISAIFSNLAEKANGSVMLRMGDTIVLATAVMSKDKREGIDFFPLTVDYEERFYSSGKILGSRFVRREGRPSDTAILSGRMVDRTIRPLFDQRLRNEVQIIITVLSMGVDDPDILAINATSLALLTSDIPWNGPVSAIRVGIKEEEFIQTSEERVDEYSRTQHPSEVETRGLTPFIINPAFEAREKGILDLIVSGKDGNISMLEAGASEIKEEKIAEAILRASIEIETLQKFQKKIAEERIVSKQEIEVETLSDGAKNIFNESIASKIDGAVFSGETGWNKIEKLKDEWLKLLREKLPDEKLAPAHHYYESAVNDALHHGATVRGIRADGRAMDEIRNLYAQAGGLSPKLHGTGIFYRGETHVLSVLTLGGPDEAQLIDNIEVKEKKRFMHHYNFPPFSGGETGRVGGTNRREIGHGALAERALLPVLPNETVFPYTVRIVSESMSSNGSTSMASVCASTVALMDGGVPITLPVAGIAIGLMSAQGGEYKILLDIQGPEDHHGDMDLKVAGTREGITAIQLDIKLDSVSIGVLKEALAIAKKARLKILDTIEEAIPKSRPELSLFAPRVLVTKINPEKIGSVIGPGGRVIQEIKAKTGVDEINIENDGVVTIVGRNGSTDKAFEIIEKITHEYKKGERFMGKVTRLADFGAFVEIAPDTEGLVHISELAPFRIEKVTDVIGFGEIIPVVVREIDERGRISLSLKDADPLFATRKGISQKK